MTDNNPSKKILLGDPTCHYVYISAVLLTDNYSVGDSVPGHIMFPEFDPEATYNFLVKCNDVRMTTLSFVFKDTPLRHYYNAEIPISIIQNPCNDPDYLPYLMDRCPIRFLGAKPQDGFHIVIRVPEHEPLVWLVNFANKGT